MDLLPDRRREHRAGVHGLGPLKSEVVEESGALGNVLDTVVQFLYTADTHLKALLAHRG